MTAVAARPAETGRALTLRALAGIEARRYARHPLFLLGVALMGWSMAASYDDLDTTITYVTVMPAFFLGIFGVFIGYGLTRSLRRTADAVRAAPADGELRTAALCLACLVPGAVSLVWLGWVYVAKAAARVPESAISPAEEATILLTGVVAAIGGPLVGVLVGRWTRFPFAALPAAVVLVGWVILGNYAGLAVEEASRFWSLVHLSAPFAFWTIELPDGEGTAVTAGSPFAYLCYLVVLCGLAAVAARLPEAAGARRARLWRVLGLLGALAVLFLVLAAVVPDPAPVPL